MHYTHTLLTAMRRQGDPLADAAVAALYASGHPEARMLAHHLPASADQLPTWAPVELAALLRATESLPEGADPALMAQGAAFFARHVRQIAGLLGAYSLPYCYAAADGAEVLYRSERIRKYTTRRLAETATFVFDVLSPGGFGTGGRALHSIRQVRLLHAAIRYHIAPEWDAERYGAPVNQEDMAGTHLAFSLIVLRGLRQLDQSVSAADARAYYHLWQMISLLLGVDPCIVPRDLPEAHLLARQIEKRHFRPSIAGQTLTASLLDSFETQLPYPVPPGYLPSFMRHLLGDQIGDLLGLPPANWTRALVHLSRWTQKLTEFPALFSPPNWEQVFEQHRAELLAQAPAERPVLPASLTE